MSFLCFRVLELCAIHRLNKRGSPLQGCLVFGLSVAVGFAAGCTHACSNLSGII